MKIENEQIKARPTRFQDTFEWLWAVRGAEPPYGSIEQFAEAEKIFREDLDELQKLGPTPSLLSRLQKDIDCFLDPSDGCFHLNGLSIARRYGLMRQVSGAMTQVFCRIPTMYLNAVRVAISKLGGRIIDDENYWSGPDELDDDQYGSDIYLTIAVPGKLTLAKRMLTSVFRADFLEQDADGPASSHI